MIINIHIIQSKYSIRICNRVLITEYYTLVSCQSICIYFLQGLGPQGLVFFIWLKSIVSAAEP